MAQKYYYIFNEGSRINQIICAVLINMPVFVYGAAIGWMSPMTLLLQSKESPRHKPLTDVEVSWMAAAAYLMCFPSVFIIAILGGKIGRKLATFILSAAGFGCWLLKLSSLEFWALTLARALVGVNMAGSYVICPLYTKEISEDAIRGMLGCMIILFHTTGNLFLYIIGGLLSYHTILWVCISFPTIHLILFTMMPDSPLYLLKRGKIEKATKALAWLRCRKVDDAMVLKELDELKKEHLRGDHSHKFVFRDILADKILFRAFKIALIVTLARESCGAVPVLNFAGTIFDLASKDTGLVLSPNQQAMMLGAVQVFGAILAIGLVEKVGRKGLLTMTSLISGLSMCVLASWFLARDFSVFAPASMPIFTLCLCIFCDAFGLQPISVVLSTELFPYRYRGTVMAVIMAAAAVIDFLQMIVFKLVIKNVPYTAFYFFGAVCLFTAAYTIMVIPETKARSRPEIYEDLKTKKEKETEMGNK